MNKSHENKRRFKRIFHDANGYLATTEGTKLSCNLLDISFNGCLISCAENTANFRVKDKFTINITLGEALQIEALAHIVYFAEDDLLGMQFDEIDIHSATFLKRLVELNIGDTSMLERDLLSLSTQGSKKSP